MILNTKNALHGFAIDLCHALPFIRARIALYFDCTGRRPSTAGLVSNWSVLLCRFGLADHPNEMLSGQPLPGGERGWER